MLLLNLPSDSRARRPGLSFPVHSSHSVSLSLIVSAVSWPSGWLRFFFGPGLSLSFSTFHTVFYPVVLTVIYIKCLSPQNIYAKP